LSMMNEKEKARRSYQVKRERTEFERVMGDLLRNTLTTNYIQKLILMVLIGIFIRMIFL